MWPAKDIQDTMKSKPKTCTNKKGGDMLCRSAHHPTQLHGARLENSQEEEPEGILHPASNSKKTSTNQHSYIEVIRPNEARLNEPCVDGNVLRLAWLTPGPRAHLEAVPDVAWIQFGSSRANGLSG